MHPVKLCKCINRKLESYPSSCKEVSEVDYWQINPPRRVIFQSFMSVGKPNERQHCYNCAPIGLNLFVSFSFVLFGFHVKHDLK